MNSSEKQVGGGVVSGVEHEGDDLAGAAAVVDGQQLDGPRHDDNDGDDTMKHARR